METKILIEQKQKIYNQVLLMVEEELYRKLNPNPTKHTVPKISKNMSGGNNPITNAKYMPGKIDIIRNGFQIDIGTALKGTLERQKLFIEEKKTK